MRNFQTLSIWSKSHQLTLKIYALSKSYPKDETFGLISQMRRRSTSADFKRFLIIAVGSASELEYQLILSKDLGYISDTVFKELGKEIIEIRKMIYSFIKKT